MNQPPKPPETPAPILKAAPVSDARKLAEALMDVMSALLGVIERETELVRAGKLTGAMALGPDKAELSRRYVSAVADLKASQEYLAQTAPELLTTLPAELLEKVLLVTVRVPLSTMAPPSPAV